MQNTKHLSKWLEENSNENHYLFTIKNLKTLFPEVSMAAFKTLVSRASTTGILHRVCRGLYLYKKHVKKDGLLLFHIAILICTHVHITRNTCMQYI